MSKTLKVGSKIQYRGRWGKDMPKETTILSIELCENEGDKYGKLVDEMTQENYMRCCLELADKHWCYGTQVDWNESVALN